MLVIHYPYPAASRQYNQSAISSKYSFHYQKIDTKKKENSLQDALLSICSKILGWCR